MIALALIVLVAAGPDVELRITAESTRVDFGKAFELTVVRTWNKKTTAAPWLDDALTPLVVRLVERSQREVGDRFEETRRYRAYAFKTGTVTLHVAPAPALQFQVRPVLETSTTGAVELPRGPFRLPTPWPLWPLPAAAATIAVAWFLRRSMGHRGTGTVGLRGPALQRLAALHERQPTNPDELRAWHVEASAVLRGYVDARFQIGVPQMTTEQVARVTGLVPRTTLVTLLAPCDLAKFARHQPSANDRDALVTRIQQFIEAKHGP